MNLEIGTTTMTERIDLSTIDNIKAEIDNLRSLVDQYESNQYRENPSTIGFRFGTLGSTFMNMVAGKPLN